jgi:hypothetical protein
MLIEPLGLELPLAGFNGGLITDTQLRELEGHPIASVAAEAAFELLNGAGLDIWIYTDTDWFVTSAEGQHVAREAWIIELEPKVASPSTGLGRIFKIVGVSDDHPRMAAAEDEAQHQLKDAASASRSALYFLDFTDMHATKGFVVHSLARQLGLTPPQIATIGDMPNDILMFQESGYSIAMGNASDQVKSRADIATDSNEDDGYAKAIDRFLLSATVTDDRRAP